MAAAVSAGGAAAAGAPGPRFHPGTYDAPGIVRGHLDPATGHPVIEDRTTVLSTTPAGDGPARVHQVVVDPSGDYVLAVDLGVDTVFGYPLDPADGTLTEVFRTTLPPGSGPRHLVFHPGGRVAYLALDPSGNRLYVANQRSGTVTWLPVDPATGIPGPAAGSLAAPGVAQILL